jgi:hypothetical protein
VCHILCKVPGTFLQFGFLRFANDHACNLVTIYFKDNLSNHLCEVLNITIHKAGSYGKITYYHTFYVFAASKIDASTERIQSIIQICSYKQQTTFTGACKAKRTNNLNNSSDYFNAHDDWPEEGYEKDVGVAQNIN